MRFRSLDLNSDWSFGRGVSSYAKEDAAIALDIATSLRSWMGNCFFDLMSGVDYLNLLAPGTKTDLDDAIQGAILSVNGVVRINTYTSQFDPQTRALSVQVSLQTVYSQSFLTQLQLLSSPLGA